MNYLDVNKEKIGTTAKDLNQLLADYHMYYQKIRNFHWNIVGKSFFDLHLKFEDMYTDAQEKIDVIAERLLTLGYQPASNYSDYLEMSTIEESKTDYTDEEMVEILLNDHHTILKQMSQVAKTAGDAQDNGTEDLMDGYFDDIEKTSWMLRSWAMKTSDSHKKI